MPQKPLDSLYRFAIFATLESLNNPLITLFPSIYMERGGPTTILEQITKNREKAAHNNAGEIIS